MTAAMTPELRDLVDRLDAHLQTVEVPQEGDWRDRVRDAEVLKIAYLLGHVRGLREREDGAPDAVPAADAADPGPPGPPPAPADPPAPEPQAHGAPPVQPGPGAGDAAAEPPAQAGPDRHPRPPAGTGTGTGPFEPPEFGKPHAGPVPNGEGGAGPPAGTAGTAGAAGAADAGNVDRTGSPPAATPPGSAARPPSAPPPARAASPPVTGPDPGSADTRSTPPSHPPSHAPSPGAPRPPDPGAAPSPSAFTMQETIQLPNVRVGSTIRERIPRTGIKGLRCTDDAGLGLDFDAESGTLSGTPRQAGDFVLKFRGVLEGRPLEISARLAVIPDPQTLWTSQPSDPSVPFYKPDEDRAVVEGDLFCVAASKRGRSHARTGACRDDDVAIAVDAAGGWHVAVVADGAGSADWSRRGSDLASRTVRDILPGLLATHLDPVIGEVVRHCREGDTDAAKGLENWFYQTLVAASFEAARAIESEAKAHGTSRNRFLTTLIATVARRVGSDWLFAGFSIGDGGAAVFDLETCTVHPLTAPDSGEFAGQTRFLLTTEFEGGWDSLRSRAFLTVLPSFTALVLMTDGITDPKFPTDVVFQDPNAWADFWQNDLTPAVDLSRGNAEAAQHLLDWMDFWSPGNHDDRTMAILVP